MSRLSVVAALAALFASQFATAAVVGSITESRAGTGWTLDGSDMTTTRAKLLETSNFGPAGTVPESIQITDMDSLSDAALTGVDVFFAGYISQGYTTFNGSELAAITGWVQSGGVIILTCDNPNYDQLCEAFGLPSSGSDGVSPAVVEASALTHPLFDGPFGSVTQVQTAGDIGYFSGLTIATVLARESSANTYPQIMEQAYGNGLVIWVGDVDTVSNYGISGGTGISTDNDIFLGNLFAYAIDQSNVQPPAAVPAVGTGGLLLLMLALLLAGLAVVRRRA